MTLFPVPLRPTTARISPRMISRLKPLEHLLAAETLIELTDLMSGISAITAAPS
jgi:hypothetical protein